jgi:hypothetical protein
MKSVHDIFGEAVALQRQGLTPRQVADRVLEIGKAEGFSNIDEYASITRGTIELVFPTGTTLYFDQANWHYLPRFPVNSKRPGRWAASTQRGIGTYTGWARRRYT